MKFDAELREQRLVFYRSHIEKIDRVLLEFLRLAGAKCALLIDKDGHMITSSGEAVSFNQDTISALVAGSFAATKEMARLIGESEFSVLYHQGERENIQLSLVGGRTIFTVIFDEATTLGMVRLYVSEAVRKLQIVLEEAESAQQNGASDEDDSGIAGEYTQDAINKLDSLFG